MENDENADSDRVSLMTLHGAKGLEFDTVFLPGWEEGLFPNQRALDEGGEKSLEEERRLAYVGLTRARRRAIISHAANRRIYANWQSSIPSRFIEELPDADVERTGSAALARDARVLAATASSGQFPLVARRTRTIEAWEQPRTSGAGRRHPYRCPGVPPEIRLRHRDGGRGRPAGRGVRQSGRETCAGSLRGEGMRQVPPNANAVHPDFLKQDGGDRSRGHYDPSALAGADRRAGHSSPPRLHPSKPCRLTYRKPRSRSTKPRCRAPVPRSAYSAITDGRLARRRCDAGRRRPIGARGRTCSGGRTVRRRGAGAADADRGGRLAGSILCFVSRATHWPTLLGTRHPSLHRAACRAGSP